MEGTKAKLEENDNDRGARSGLAANAFNPISKKKKIVATFLIRILLNEVI
jgi:hypothetical protein